MSREGDGFRIHRHHGCAGGGIIPPGAIRAEREGGEHFIPRPSGEGSSFLGLSAAVKAAAEVTKTAAIQRAVENAVRARTRLETTIAVALGAFALIGWVLAAWLAARHGYLG